MKRVAVIGAGVVGALVSRELTKYNFSVTILERMSDVAMGATRANSAIVHAGFDAKEGSLKARFNVQGSKMMEKVASELGVKYNKCGSLVVGFNDEDRQTLKELLERGNKNGVEGLRIVEREELIALEPNLGDGVQHALLAPTGAIICPYELCVAGVGNAMDNGAELKLDFEVASIHKNGDEYVITSTCGERVTADYVINCAGVYSDKIAKMVGDDSFTVNARRGEYMLLDKECGAIVSRTVFRCPSKMGKGVLVSPTVDGNLLLGPTAENIEDKEDTSTTPTGLSTLARLATEQVKNIPTRQVITSFTGLRAVGSTGDFIINEKDGFVNVAGVESPGLSSAPAIAQYVVELLEKAGAEIEVNNNFNPYRPAMHHFREADIDEKNRIISADSSYAHVICRCETVTEGEILAAVRSNPKPRDVDGVKRRTRATMGRCQGGFCTPYIVELLAREMGVAYDSITKFGGGSIINMGRTKEADYEK